MADRSQFLVYLLVDERDRIHYVGRGTHDRAMAHGEFDGNQEIAAAYREGQLWGVVLDCETEHAMVVTEGALIDALTTFKPSPRLANRRLDKYRFVPSRVPAEFVDRQRDKLLDPKAVAEKVGGPVLYVRTKEGAIDYDDRGVIDPLRPDPWAIADRIEESWMLDPWLSQWKESPELAPKAVIGLSGSKHDRYILGSLDVCEMEWPEATGNRSRYHTVPWAKMGQPDDVTSEDIDAFGLCGFRMTGVQFGQHPVHQMRFHDRDGELVPRP